MSDKYRIEEMSGGGWVLVRNHDDEPISVYATKREANLAMMQANKDAAMFAERGKK